MLHHAAYWKTKLAIIKIEDLTHSSYILNVIDVVSSKIEILVKTERFWKFNSSVLREERIA